MTRILVTGGTGFIGAAFVRRLVRDGHGVRVLDNDLRGNAGRLADLRDRFELVVGDVRSSEVVTQAAAGMDRVVHLAALNGTENFYKHPELVLDVGIRGMLAVVDACRANGIGDLVVASSSEAYQTPPVVPTPETVPLTVPDVLNPRYSYGGSKIATELIAMNYGRTGFDRVAVFRPHNVYGPDMGFEHVVPQLAMRAADLVAASASGPVDFPIQGTGEQTRSFIHIDDFVDGLMLVLDKGQHLGVYHIGTEDEVTIRALAATIVGCFGREARVVPGEEPAGATPRRCPDVSKLRALGFAPRISLEEGLPPVVQWYQRNRAPERA